MGYETQAQGLVYAAKGIGSRLAALENTMRDFAMKIKIGGYTFVQEGSLEAQVTEFKAAIAAVAVQPEPYMLGALGDRVQQLELDLSELDLLRERVEAIEATTKAAKAGNFETMDIASDITTLLDSALWMSYKSSWGDAKKDIDEYVLADDSVFFKSEPVMEFAGSADGVRTAFAEFCLPAESELEFFMRLEAETTGDEHSLYAVELVGLGVDAEGNDVVLPLAQQTLSKGASGPGRSMSLYYRGNTGPNVRKIIVSYGAQDVAANSVSKENGFSWGYKVFNDG
eukprot:CAMPEP_0170463730 /NCGR_PEP_ID=MMETSP0123-20130129/8731_1 /TAXON_ID=182087 /ORGANISM="Favella ehrenbergii, Strain Fehren 1" /LENGTH=283 /DNA_ID=CAMNT_0010729233 /DNA_START=386 /DNA_END=1237 /DNA_ORIENTATION=-